MPLKKGKSKEVFKKNLVEVMKSGKPKDQALAIAMKASGKAKPKKK